jgi:hypothetical protein
MNSKFIPYKLVKKVIGRKIVLITVRTFMTSLSRAELTEKYASMIEMVRSRLLSI